MATWFVVGHHAPQAATPGGLSLQCKAELLCALVVLRASLARTEMRH
jgi:hypothetical protein